MGKKKAEKKVPPSRRKGGTWKIVLLTVVVFIALIIGIIYLFSRIRRSRGSWGNPFESSNYVEDNRGGGAGVPEPTKAPEAEPGEDAPEHTEETTLEETTGSEAGEQETLSPAEMEPTIHYYDEPRIAHVSEEGIYIFETLHTSERTPLRALKTGEDLMVLGDAVAWDNTVWYIVENWEGIGYLRKAKNALVFEKLSSQITPTPVPEEGAVMGQEATPSKEPEATPAREPEATPAREPEEELVIGAEDEVILIG